MRAFVAALLCALLVTPAAAAERSLAELEAAARVAPQSAAAWDRYGMALARARRYPDAQQAFGHALALAPQDHQVLHHRAIVTAWSGDYAQAIGQLAPLVARHPRDLGLRVDYGQVLAWNRAFDQAQRQYEIALQQDPNHADALRHLGILHGWQGRYSEAVPLIERARAADPKDLRVLRDLAEVLSWKGELVASAAAYEQLLAAQPQDLALQLKLAQVYASAGRSRAAREAYGRVLAADPGQVEAAVGLARVHRDDHQLAEAERVLRAAYAARPGEARLSQELATLAAAHQWTWERLLSLTEPLIYLVLFGVLYRHLWRYRRVLRSHRVATPALLAALPLLAMVTIALFLYVLIGGAYYREIETATRALETAALAILLVLVGALVWLLRFERPGRMRTVLAIGAHPDDIEFGCGATLLRWREEGATTLGLVLTGGERGGAPDEALRVTEARAGARVLALSAIEFAAFPDTQLAAHAEALRLRIEEAIRRHQPDVILTHNRHDTHSDHRAVFEATREAARAPCTLLCYENPNTPPAFEPTYFVEVAGHVDDKVAAIARHKTQADKPYARPELIRAAAAFRGTQARLTAAEAFEVVRVLERLPS